MKIVQIVAIEDVLYGLGDDGVLYERCYQSKPFGQHEYTWQCAIGITTQKSALEYMATWLQTSNIKAIATIIRLQESFIRDGKLTVVYEGARDVVFQANDTQISMRIVEKNDKGAVTWELMQSGESIITVVVS